jgi:hypothetical protein
MRGATDAKIPDSVDDILGRRIGADPLAHPGYARWRRYKRTFPGMNYWPMLMARAMTKSNPMENAGE